MHNSWSGYPDLNRRFAVLQTAALIRLAIPAENLEGATGLEPARNSLKGCVLGRFAFIPAKLMWYAWKDSNFHLLVSKTSASPFGLHARGNLPRLRLELRTSCLQDRRSSHFELPRRNCSERQDLNLRTLVPKTSPFSHLRNALIFRCFGFGERIRTLIYWFRASRPAG